MIFPYRYVKKNSLVSSYPVNKAVYKLLLLSELCLIITFIYYGRLYFFKPIKETFVSPLSENSEVLGQSTEMDNNTPVINSASAFTLSTPTPPPTITPALPTITPIPIITLKKEVYKIAVFGDSMVDTMGENMDYLQRSLRRKYPNNGFLLFNYGTGAQTVEDGLRRFNSAFSYQTRNFPSISDLRPDVLIIGSFSYNPFFPHDKEKHRATLEQLVNEAKNTGAKVFLLAEIAPLKRGFGKGINGVNWDDKTSYQHATEIIELLENTYSVAKTTGVPLIDAFSPSQINSEKEGRKEYVNPDDGIHPSVVGHQLMAELMVATVKLD